MLEDCGHYCWRIYCKSEWLVDHFKLRVVGAVLCLSVCSSHTIHAMLINFHDLYLNVNIIAVPG
jgi:hypothetical protein